MVFLLAIILIFTGTLADAATRYVDGTLSSACTSNNYSIANRTCTGSDGNAYKTVAAGVSAMSGGDILYLRGGTYAEAQIDLPASKNGTAGAYTTIASYPGEWAIINGTSVAAGSKMWIIGHYGFDKDGGSNTAYWKLERLEITGAQGGTDEMAAGIWISGGPHIMRYLYIHDNYGVLINSNSENPAGIVGMIWNGCTVEYCYFKDNGTNNATDEMHSAIGIQIHSDYLNGTAYFYPTPYNPPYCTHNNTIRYNLFENASGRALSGIHDKALQYLTPRDRAIDWTYKDWGNKVHHNIFKGIKRPIGTQVDFSQIHNNIAIDATGSEGSGAIDVGDPGNYSGISAVTVYNNTIAGGGEIGASFQATYSGSSIQQPNIYWYNNIIDQPSDADNFVDMTIGMRWMDAAYPYNSALTTIQHNYIYRPDNTSQIKVVRNTGACYNNMTFANFDSCYSTTNYVKATSENTDSLYAGTSGSNKYITRGSHVVSGSTTIANGGIGAAHPYLTSVTLPSYIGATNPTDYAWVSGVLGLTSTTVLTAGTSSDPAWIEGSGVTATTPTYTGSMTGGGAQMR